MAENTSLARPYATAAFEYAKERSVQDSWSDMLGVIAAVAADPEAQSVLNHPRVDTEQLTTFMLGITEGKLDDAGQNFVRILAENRRLGLAPEIASLFESKRAADEARIDVEVISAYKLSAKHKTAIGKAMKEKLGREVTLSTEIDRSLMAGVIIRAGDTVLDASLQGRFAKLASELAG